MARQWRLEYESAVYQVTACGNGRQSPIMLIRLSVDFSTSCGVKWSNSSGVLRLCVLMDSQEHPLLETQGFDREHARS